MFGVQRRGLRRDCNRSQLRRTDGKSGRCPHRFIDGGDGGRADRLADNHSAGIGRRHFGLRRVPDGSASHVALAAIAEQGGGAKLLVIAKSNSSSMRDNRNGANMFARRIDLTVSYSYLGCCAAGQIRNEPQNQSEYNARPGPLAE